MSIQLDLSEVQLERLKKIAQARKQDVNEMLADAIATWLEQEAKREHAREVLREFAKGIGAGEPPHDGAQNHDKYLYGKP